MRLAPDYDGCVYLYATPELAHERMVARGRREELHVDIGYMRLICEQLGVWINARHPGALRLNAAESIEHNANRCEAYLIRLLAARRIVVTHRERPDGSIAAMQLLSVEQRGQHSLCCIEDESDELRNPEEEDEEESAWALHPQPREQPQERQEEGIIDVVGILAGMSGATERPGDDDDVAGDVGEQQDIGSDNITAGGDGNAER